VDAKFERLFSPDTVKETCAEGLIVATAGKLGRGK
jgi:hypothetical protein